MQTAFIVFMVFSPIRFFRVNRLIKAVEHEGGRPTAGSLNAAHHIHMSTFLQGFLHRKQRSSSHENRLHGFSGVTRQNRRFGPAN